MINDVLKKSFHGWHDVFYVTAKDHWSLNWKHMFWVERPPYMSVAMFLGDEGLSKRQIIGGIKAVVKHHKKLNKKQK